MNAADCCTDAHKPSAAPMRSDLPLSIFMWHLLEQHKLAVTLFYLEIKIDIRLVVEEAVGAQRCEQVHEEVMHTANHRCAAASLP